MALPTRKGHHIHLALEAAWRSELPLQRNAIGAPVLSAAELDQCQITAHFGASQYFKPKGGIAPSYSIFFKYWPVKDAGQAAMSSGCRWRRSCRLRLTTLGAEADDVVWAFDDDRGCSRERSTVFSASTKLQLTSEQLLRRTCAGPSSARRGYTSCGPWRMPANSVAGKAALGLAARRASWALAEASSPKPTSQRPRCDLVADARQIFSKKPSASSAVISSVAVDLPR